MNPKTLAANLILDHVRGYINAKSYANDKAKQGGLSFRQWTDNLDDVMMILGDVQTLVNQQPVVVFQLSGSHRLIFGILKASIADENVVALLPLATSAEYGDNYVHIVNESLYTVATKYHFIEKGDTFCNRGARSRGIAATYVNPTCPGCLAKAKGVIVNHLLSEAKNDYLKVAQALTILQQ